jgi:hypothetical protein
MQINDLNSLISQVEEDDMWGSLIDNVSELYLEKGGEYTVRLIGPTYKAMRCYISRGNKVATKMSVKDFKNVLNGNPVNINQGSFSASSIQEFETASNKSKWSKCLIATVILIHNNRNLVRNSRLYWLAIPRSAVYDLMKACKADQSICLSGVMANDIILRKDSRAPFQTHAEVTSRPVFLSKTNMDMILQEGLKDPSEFYRALNQRNISRKHGFFYSFIHNKKTSSLDKHLEPIKQVENYIEEDRQHNHIQGDPRMMAELEGVSLVEFIDIE